MINNLDDSLDLGLVVGVVSVQGADQLLHQHVVDLVRFHAFESDMKVASYILKGFLCALLFFRQEVLKEWFGIRVDPVGIGSHSVQWQMSAADHHQVLHQVGMERLAQFQQRLLVVGLDVALSKRVDLGVRAESIGRLGPTFARNRGVLIMLKPFHACQVGLQS